MVSVMDDINKRLVSVLDYFFNGNVSEMARKTNVPQPTLNNIVANRLSKPSAENLSRIANSIELLNSGWLLTGEGEMIKQPVRNEVEAIPEDKYIMAEYADLRSFAGRLGGSDIEQLPETHKRLLPREYEKGNYLVVRVSGDSMNDGTSRSLCDGDEVLVRELAPSEWENLPIRNRLFIITSRECSKTDKRGKQRRTVYSMPFIQYLF